MTLLVLGILLLAIVPLVLAATAVGTLGWLVTYIAVLVGLAVALRLGLREQPKPRERRLR